MSIKEVAEMIVEAMNFTGEVVVSFLQRVFDVCVCVCIRGVLVYLYPRVYPCTSTGMTSTGMGITGFYRAACNADAVL